MKKEIIVCDECKDTITDDKYWVVNVWRGASINKQIDLCRWCAENMFKDVLEEETFDEVTQIVMDLEDVQKEEQ